VSTIFAFKRCTERGDICELKLTTHLQRPTVLAKSEFSLKRMTLQH